MDCVVSGCVQCRKVDQHFVGSLFKEHRLEERVVLRELVVLALPEIIRAEPIIIRQLAVIPPGVSVIERAVTIGVLSAPPQHFLVGPEAVFVVRLRHCATHLDPLAGLLIIDRDRDRLEAGPARIRDECGYVLSGGHIAQDR